MQKTAPKNSKYSRNETILKMGHLAKAIAHAKAIAFVEWAKTWVKPFWKNIKVVLWKKPLQKTPNIREIGPFWKSTNSLCRMRHFGSKVKNAKNMQKPILQEHYGCFVQKTAKKKKHQITRIETILNISHLAKVIAHGKAIAFVKWSVWVKN